MTMSALSDELAQVRTKKKEFLAQIERIVPWKEWLTLIQPCYYKGERGNKPYPLETMLRLYLLQNLYDLSDEATAAEAIDSRAFSDFCGVDSSNQVPNGDTIGRFRNLLVKNGRKRSTTARICSKPGRPCKPTGFVYSQSGVSRYFLCFTTGFQGIRRSRISWDGVLP